MIGFIQCVLGAKLTRSTKTWSPISRVFSMELEGISNACRLKVMMNRPVTSTAAMEAINSMVVSRGFSFFTAFLSLFLAKSVYLIEFVSLRRRMRRHPEELLH